MFILMLVLEFVVLTAGAELLVRGSSGLAMAMVSHRCSLAARCALPSVTAEIFEYISNAAM